MADLCARFGGMRDPAWQAMTPEVGTAPDGVQILHVRPDPDSRLGYAVIDTLSKALRSKDQTYLRGDVLLPSLRLLSFYWPLFTSGFRFDDSGGGKPAIGPVLAPNRCRYLLDCWLSVDRPSIEGLLDECSVFFDLALRPHAKFSNARALLDYLGCYASFLEQAVARDSFYFSFDGNSLGTGL